MENAGTGGSDSKGASGAAEAVKEARAKAAPVDFIFASFKNIIFMLQDGAQ
jgi:hypothetical protein